MQPSVERIRWRTLALAAVTGAAWWATIGEGASGVLAGGIVVVVSVWLYEQIFRAAVVTGRRRLAMALTFVKLAAFIGLGWIAFTIPDWAPNPAGFVVGVSALPVAALWEALKTRRH